MQMSGGHWCQLTGASQETENSDDVTNRVYYFFNRVYKISRNITKRCIKYEILNLWHVMMLWWTILVSPSQSRMGWNIFCVCWADSWWRRRTTGWTAPWAGWCRAACPPGWSWSARTWSTPWDTELGQWAPGSWTPPRSSCRGCLPDQDTILLLPTHTEPATRTSRSGESVNLWVKLFYQLIQQ